MLNIFVSLSVPCVMAYKYVNEADIVHSAIVANGDCFAYMWSTISTHPLSQLGDGALARSVLGELAMCK